MRRAALPSIVDIIRGPLNICQGNWILSEITPNVDKIR